MFWYATASLTPALLLALACVFAGSWPLLAVLSITVVVFFADKIGKALPETAGTGRGVSVALAAVHFPLLFLGVWAIGTGAHLSTIDKVLLFTGLGLFFGQISNSNAHELIHARDRAGKRLGAALYISMLHGHHVSAHLRVHHVYAGTDKDPNSARRGEGFWAFVLRASVGEFMAGFRADQAHRARHAGRLSWVSHPYLAYVLGGLALLTMSFLIGGLVGLLAHIGIAIYAQMQLLLSDYVQHYGLRRKMTARGVPEPVGPEHSWNAPKWYSSAMMLNAPRHSDHHMRPAKAYPALTVTPQTMPILPHSLPVMAVIALVPPLWRRMMDRRVARWQEPA
ncbi:MAG: alkane 1-monooxygenase [Pseudomonadota bacterium]